MKTKRGRKGNFNKGRPPQGGAVKRTGSAYKRGWHHTKTRGKENVTSCDFCGRKVPKYKTFAVYRGFRITDPLVRQELGGKGLNLGGTKSLACPACARHRKIVKKRNI
ncbi:MAG: hypothetical protein ABIH52_01930 [Candidatus Aenigmatarchaeota archaeon]|nr:hypothetical protein [Nanoarchaeota archaeon]